MMETLAVKELKCNDLVTLVTLTKFTKGEITCVISLSIELYKYKHLALSKMVKNNQLRVINQKLRNDQCCSVFNSLMAEVLII